MNNIITINAVSLTYQSREGEINAIEDISFETEHQEFLSIIGPSGCGKSTLLSIIAGILPPTEGTIELSVDAPLSNMGYMLQKDSLFSWRTIRQNVQIGLEIMGQLNEEGIAYTDGLLKTYGLWEFKDSYPSQLSGGMRQRAALIRTLSVKPEILLLDEPFSALDYQTRLAVNDDIHYIIKNEKKMAIMVTHDISEAVAMSDRVIVLTKRPSRIKSQYHIQFAKQEKSPLARRDMPEFKDYFNAIWRDIDVHV